VNALHFYLDGDEKRCFIGYLARDDPSDIALSTDWRRLGSKVVLARLYIQGSSLL
jgi:hypothetical protein